MAEIKIDLKKYEGQEIKIKIQNGVAIIEGEEKVKYPKKGYWVDEAAEIRKFYGGDYERWGLETQRNVYPNVNHAILFGQVLAPLLVKHWVLTGGYWDTRVFHVVRYSVADSRYCVCNGYGSAIGPLQFPFPNQELAEQFLEENREQLNKITELWHQK